MPFLSENPDSTLLFYAIFNGEFMPFLSENPDDAFTRMDQVRPVRVDELSSIENGAAKLFSSTS